MTETDARADWTRRSGRRRDVRASSPGATASPPTCVRAHPGRGHVTLDWESSDTVCGYAVYRAEPGNPLAVIDHLGGDILAVPDPPYADTTGEPGRSYRYAVAGVVAPDAPHGPLSDEVECASEPAGAATVWISADSSKSAGPMIRPWWMIGSEHLSQLEYTHGPGPEPAGTEFTTALSLAHDELGARYVRAHSILHDELGVYSEPGGTPQYDFAGIDRIYDRVLELGYRPIVEVGFMPRALAAWPEATVFTYRGIISPPKDWDRWAELTRRLAEHLVGRYGLEEVAHWAFEIWNEANLEVFWTGDQDDYFRLYESAARAIKSVDERLRVGGPASAAGGWVLDFTEWVVARNCPLDFVSTHAYGVPPLDFKRALGARGLEVPVWWTEWGVSPTHFAEVNDSVFAAPFLLRGMKAAQTAADALSYWVVSDHFEELGRPHGLLHGGFGLMTVGNLRKPRYWALALANQLGNEALGLELGGDGAGSLVDALAARRGDGAVDLLMWNGTLAQSQLEPTELLSRRVHVEIGGLAPGDYEATLARVDHDHSNLNRRWPRAPGWPDAAQWERLRSADRLEDESLGRVALDSCFETDLELPSPGIARLRLAPVR